jgi:L-threonylcarbamoyladenylate synthase
MKMNTPIITPKDAVELLKQGKVGVMPTDTVYGIVASAQNKASVERLYALKHRERKPGTLVASSFAQLHSLGVPEKYFDKLHAYWPGPLSAVLPIAEEFSYLHQGVGDIAMRIVSDKDFSIIVEQTGPLLTSSANQPGAPGSVTIQQAIDYFDDQVDFYVDGGDLSGRPPSTIVKLKDDGSLTVIRQGAVEIK